MLRDDLIAIVTGRGKWVDLSDKPGIEFSLAYPHATEPRWAEIVVWEGDPKLYPTATWWDGFQGEQCTMVHQTGGSLEELVSAAELWVEIPQVADADGR